MDQVYSSENNDCCMFRDGALGFQFHFSFISVCSNTSLNGLIVFTGKKCAFVFVKLL